jgi:hypothetical protein
MRFLMFLATAVSLMAQPQTLLENDQVRVLKVIDQPHTKSQPHEHKLNRVIVYLQPGREEIVSGGKKNILTWKAGDARWSPATTGPHTSEIVSDAPVTLVEIEIKKPADASKTVNTPLDPLKVDPGDYKLQFENSQVRVLRVRIPAHRKVAMHEHVLNRVVVYLTDQNGTMTSPDGKTETAQHQAGDASWGGATKHSEENSKDTPFQGVVVELKS